MIAVDDIEVCTAFALSNNQLRNTARHIARHDPARVLREVEVKRQIVRDISTVTLFDWARPLDDAAQEGYVKALERFLRSLAAVYSDHPDYNPEWSIT